MISGPLVWWALQEDLGAGDLTTELLSDPQKPVTALIRNRQACVVSGLGVVSEVFRWVDPTVQVVCRAQNGHWLEAGSTVCELSGPLASILKAERTTLNFLQHLCGIATETHRFVQAVAGTQARIAATRKTTPGLRLLEKQAVVDGGGTPHRFNLGSAAMVKDNHRFGFHSFSTLRERLPHTATLTIEVDSLSQIPEALSAGAHIILLDNFSLADLKTAVNTIQGRALTEASGGVTLDTVRAIAETGVDVISTSRLTLGAPAVDLGLDIDA
jgi:nicotinate-nucleotide pyrophosphorylase (carboxylating)